MAPPSIDELTLRLDKETDLRERGLKYAHNMMEDLKEAFSDFRVSFARVESGFASHVEEDKKMSAVMDIIYKDVKNLTRLVYIGVGGVLVIGGMVAVVGERILNLLSHG
jgi:hypothetical protein